MQKPSLGELKTATELYASLRQQKEEVQVRCKAELEPIEAKLAEIEVGLIASLKATGWHETPEAGDGSRFSREVKTSFKIVDEAKALAWATENNMLSISLTKAGGLLRRAIHTPEGFEETTTEYLKVKKPKTD